MTKKIYPMTALSSWDKRLGAMFQGDSVARDSNTWYDGAQKEADERIISYSVGVGPQRTTTDMWPVSRITSILKGTWKMSNC